MLAQAEVVPGEGDAIEELVAAGDGRKAIEICARRHGAALGRFCMSLLGSQADAEEAVQETLIAAHAGLASWRGQGSLKGWLFGIARRQCARHNQRRKRAQHLQLVAVDHGGESGDPADLIAARQRAGQVRAALSRLKPSERETLLLRFQAGLSYREIAAACGIDEPAARKRASRALARLRQTFSTEDDR